MPQAGLGIGLIVAAPQLAGLLRLGAPSLIGRLWDRKRFCLTAYLLSAMALLALPWAASPGRLPSPAMSLAALVALWCVYQVLEYLGTVALWSWFADLAPAAIRGRFLGRRERWMAAGQAVGMVLAAGFLWTWHDLWPQEPQWTGYAVAACAGACAMIAALAPLALIPRAVVSPAARGGVPLSALLAPLADRRFLWLLAFGCWLSFCHGAIETPMNVFPYRALGLGVWVMLWLKTGLRLGQMAIAPRVGRWIDRWGNRPAMAVSLAVVAQASLFYFLATPQRPWWIAGAWALWVAWVGLNIGQPNLMLKLSPGRANTSYIAVWFTATGLCYAASTVTGRDALRPIRRVHVHRARRLPLGLLPRRVLVRLGDAMSGRACCSGWRSPNRPVGDDSGDGLVDGVLQAGLGLDADEAVHDLAPLEEHQRGNAADAVIGPGGLAVVDVDLDHLQRARRSPRPVARRSGRSSGTDRTRGPKNRPRPAGWTLRLRRKNSRR